MGLAPSPVSMAAIWVVGSEVVGTMVEETTAHHPQQSHPSLSCRGQCTAATDWSPGDRSHAAIDHQWDGGGSRRAIAC
uniref:Uncharacterized protein n=1 Tax=Oryza meridionalis TaxID=40149 RepID=A0A0E0E2B5_9ORYZ